MIAKKQSRLVILRGTAWACSLLLLSLPASAADIPAFPDAEGFGAVSIGGRGGKVVHVTNLNDSGPGSFREAVRTRGPRIVVFDVGGTVHLHDEIEMQGDNGRITIAGQTAPGGITFIGGTLSFPGWAKNKPIRTPDIIVRHLRVRGVHGHSVHSEGGDCLDIYKAERVVIDHCSFSGSCDETVDACHTQQYTFQWCTIEEPALWGQGNNQHGENSHNFAFLFSYDAKNISCHHNLFIHSSNRNPLISKGVADVRNNVCYNYKIGLAAHGTDRMNIVGNTYKNRVKPSTWISPFYGLRGEQHHYFKDNALDTVYTQKVINAPAKDLAGLARVSYTGPKSFLAEPHPIPFQGKTHTSEEGYNIALATAGAWPRDATTRRCVQEIKDRTGDYGLGGPWERFPTRSDGPTSAKNDTDRDGMPDAWETKYGLNPGDPADGSKVVPKGASKDDRHAGYTYVEYYLNDLSDSLIGADAELCAVEMTVQGEGRVGCESGGWTYGWHRLGTPREVFWGATNVFNKGSSAIIRAVPFQGQLFSHWEGGSVDGNKEKQTELKIEADMKVTAHFVPDPDYGKPVKVTVKSEYATVEVRLYAYPAGVNAKTHGNGLGMGSDGNVYSVVGDGRDECRLVQFNPKNETMTDLGSVAATKGASEKPSLKGGTGGWAQVPPVQMADGAVYFATINNLASVYGVWRPHLGGLFKYTPDAGIERIRDGSEYYGLLHADTATGKLYVVAGKGLDNRQTKFMLRVFDTDSGTWSDLGALETRCVIRESLESVLPDGKGGFLTTFFPSDGTTRFDMTTGKTETVKMAPYQRVDKEGAIENRYFPWSRAVTDGKTAYVATHRWGTLYRTTELFSCRPGDWPDIEFKRVGNIDPEGRVVYTRNLSLTPDGKSLVIAGKCMVGEFKTGRFDGVWVIDRATGESHLAADITAALKRSFKDDNIALVGNEYIGDNVVGKDGTIYVGVRKMPAAYYPHTPDVATDLRLMALRITPTVAKQ